MCPSRERLIRCDLLASLVGALTGAAGGHNDQGNADRQQIAQATRIALPASGCHRDHSGQTT